MQQGWRLAVGMLGAYGPTQLVQATPVPRLTQMDDAVTIALTALVSAIEDGPNEFVQNARDGMRHALSYTQVRFHDQIVRSFQSGMADAYRSAGGFYYQRFSSFTPATCIACIMLHGRIYQSPDDFQDHLTLLRVHAHPLRRRRTFPKHRPECSWFRRRNRQILGTNTTRLGSKRVQSGSFCQW
jgi:hypothetical protein